LRPTTSPSSSLRRLRYGRALMSPRPSAAPSCPSPPSPRRASRSAAGPERIE
jgi:hypothetical protein